MPATIAPAAPANLSANRLQAALRKLGACEPARTWARRKDYATAWQECRNPEWLLWLLEETNSLSPRANELLVCRFAREVVHLNTDPRVLACIETRERWARGEASDGERESALDSAWDSAWEADSAWAPARASARASARDFARDSAGEAAWASADASARDSSDDSADDSAWASAWASARATQCEIIREMFSRPTL